MRLHPDYTLFHLNTIDSTNEEAKRMLGSGYRSPTKNFIVMAEKQTAGRGRKGRNWVSEKGNLYCTFVIEPSLSSSQCPLLSFVTLVALKKAIEPYINRGKISYKWPNDLLVDDKKIAGILLEMDYVQGKRGQHVIVVGIGLNINSFPTNIEYEATKLSDYTDQTIALTPLIYRLIEQFDVHKCLLEQGKFSQIRDLWIQNAKGIGSRIEVRLANQHYYGIFERLGQAGELVLLLENGEKKQIVAGDVFF